MLAYIKSCLEVFIIILPIFVTFSQVCSGSWDSRINVWHTKESDPGANSVSVKKRRKDSEDVELQSEVTYVTRSWNMDFMEFSLFAPKGKIRSSVLVVNKS